MNPAYWGPGTWKLLHCVAEMYPEKPDKECQKKHTKFLRLLGELLPCSVCQQHYLDMLRENPPEPHLRSKESFRAWLNERHNEVNKRLNKPIVPIEQLDKILPKPQENQVLMEERNRQKTTTTMLYVSLAIGIFLFLMVIIIAVIFLVLPKMKRNKRN